MINTYSTGLVPVRGESTVQRPMAAFATALLVLVTASAAGAAPVPVDTWSYSPTTKQLVGENGSLPFSIKGGATAYDASGTPAIAFTTAPSLATYTGTTFVTPGAADFSYEAVMSMDKLRPRSTPNVFQHGLYKSPQVKLQLNRDGVPQCVLHGTGGRIHLTSATPSLNDGGSQHTFSCWREGETVGVTVDGVSTTATFALGTVTPTGKPTAGNRTSTGKAGDQLFGKLWRVSVAIG